MVLLCGLVIGAGSPVLAETRSGNLEFGQRLYQQHCLGCHGARLDGKGPDAASLRVPPANFHTYLSRIKDDAEFEKAIKQFLGMHSWEETLTDEQVHDLIAYIRSAVAQVEVNR
jgi:mono/diheme cytochrome c family protein